MPLRRSGAFTTFAVLNFIVGGLLLLCSVCSGIDLTRTEDFLNQEIPNYSTYKLGGAVLGFILGLGLIASGVGLLTCKTGRGCWP